MLQEIIRWFLIGEEIQRGQRLMSNDVYGEGKEDKINPAVSSKSRDGDENGNANGNDRRSKDDMWVRVVFFSRIRNSMADFLAKKGSGLQEEALIWDYG
ncbi:hypothetical protein Q3G72_005157 [Acer saccharum]|nr:hypothetical protein Q3G72_005157 [Acer saccharum]